MCETEVGGGRDPFDTVTGTITSRALSIGFGRDDERGEPARLDKPPPPSRARKRGRVDSTSSQKTVTWSGGVGWIKGWFRVEK